MMNFSLQRWPQRRIRINMLCNLCYIFLFSSSSVAFQSTTTNTHRNRQQFRRSTPPTKTVLQNFLKEETKTTAETIPDETVNDPASMVFYDEVDQGGIVCARGVCVLVDDDEDFEPTEASSSDDFLANLMNSYIGPRIFLAFASILYGTNFPLGAIMNDAIPPSAATCARMVLASLALSPFLIQINPVLGATAILCGCFTALGYITQSLALVTVSPATVAFLGAVTVIVCPTLEALINKKPMSLQDAPQTWLAAALCLVGVGILELCGGETGDVLGWGDVLAILQAIGFGTSFFITERLMRQDPSQALPITAVQVSTTAFLCAIWCFSDGWMFGSDGGDYALWQLFTNPTLRIAAGAVAWTGT